MALDQLLERRLRFRIAIERVQGERFGALVLLAAWSFVAMLGGRPLFVLTDDDAPVPRAANAP